ncbi:hypothetical protein BH10ACI3_BH10ACI3_01410 [soil metagenome]
MIYRECQVRPARIPFLLVVLCLSFLLASCGHSTAAFIAKGEEYLQKRKFHDALMQFRSAVEADSESSRAHWGMARAFENLGQFNDVLDELRKTVEFDDTNLEAKAKLGTYFLLVQPPMTAEAEKIRDQIFAADPKFIEGHMLTATIMAAQGRPDQEVIDAVNRAIAMDPKRVESYVALSRLYMTREKGPEAEAAIKRAIVASPESVLAYTEYGRFLMYAKRDADAEAQFNKAISLDPSSIDAREVFAEFYVSSGQMPKAEKAYVDLVQIQENSPESRLELAGFYDKADRQDDAIATLNQILTDAPDYALARYRLGEIYLDRRDIANVNEQLDALFKINDDDIEALTLRSKAYLQENKAEDAIKDLEKILGKAPSAREPLYLIAQARLALNQVEQANAFINDLERYHPKFIKSGLLRIQAAFTTGDSQAALKLSTELLAKLDAGKSNSDMDEKELLDLRLKAQTSRGLANLDLGKLAEAKTDLADVVRVAPRSSSAMVNLAKVSIAEGNYAGALELYNKALAAEPRSFDAVSGIVSTSIKLNQADKALAKTDELIASNVGRGDVQAALHYLKSTIFDAQKNIASTETELLKAIELDPDYLPAYSAYAGLLAGLKRTDEAVAQYQKVIEKRPAAQVYTMLGILEEGRGNTTEAEKAYRKALELTPQTPIAANNLAWLIVENQGNLDEALQLATLAVGKNPTTAGFYDTLGWVYLKKGLTSSAVEQMKKAVALEEGNAKRTGATPNPGYRVRLGMALAKAGDKTSARREVETSLRFANEMSQREVTDAKSVLASL